ALGCADEVRHAREILTRGTSAQRQIKIYNQAMAGGAAQADAFIQVVDWLIAETVRDL
ncbi:MAG: carboxylate-amine ligase, partial [Alphaproteobacteria bacterium]|nr:carboxylate-amine ligase [Alphaproteobacteria bacterium]